MSIISISGRMGSGKDVVGRIIQYLTETDNSAYTLALFEQDLAAGLTTDWKIKKFAEKLKQIASILTGIDVAEFEKQEVKNSYLGEEWVRYRVITKGFPNKYVYNRELAANEVANAPIIKRYVEELFTVRQLLQEIGTEAMRDVIHPNIWVNALFADYKFEGCKNNGDRCETPNGDCNSNHCYPNWIITDVRFPNELQAVKDRGGITIRVNRIQFKTFKSDEGCLISWLPIEGIDYVPHESEIALDNSEFDYEIDNSGTIEDLIEKVKVILQKENII